MWFFIYVYVSSMNKSHLSCIMYQMLFLLLLSLDPYFSMHLTLLLLGTGKCSCNDYIADSTAGYAVAGLHVPLEAIDELLCQSLERLESASRNNWNPTSSGTVAPASTCRREERRWTRSLLRIPLAVSTLGSAGDIGKRRNATRDETCLLIFPSKITNPVETSSPTSCISLWSDSTTHYCLQWKSCISHWERGNSVSSCPLFFGLQISSRHQHRQWF